MVANTLPAINDMTEPELRVLLSAASRHCPIICEAREAAIKVPRWIAYRLGFSLLPHLRGAMCSMPVNKVNH